MRLSASITAALLLSGSYCAGALAGKLSIVIDDVGYQLHYDRQVLRMPLPISVAILPNSPHAREMALEAHAQGREILIHMPMAPLSKQPLEKNTLQPSMSGDEVRRIIQKAVADVPYAVGMNNHMGSAMTSSLSGMQNVMTALEQYRLYFLDSVTIGNTQATRAAAGTGVKVIRRKVFLDDSANEAEIRRQFNRAIDVARKTGSAIAIGHPRPATVKVLQQMLPGLPADITLVRPSSLLNEAHSPDPRPVTPGKKPFRGIGQCVSKHPPQPVRADAMFSVIGSSLKQSAPVRLLIDRWQFWFGKAGE